MAGEGGGGGAALLTGGERASARRIGCGWWLAGLGLFAVMGLFSLYFPEGVERALVHELGGRIAYTTRYLPPQRIDVVPASVTNESFQAAARRVSGWDLIVVLDPYGNASVQLRDPILASRGERLRRDLAEVKGFMDDGVYRVLVVRGERLVESFYVRGPFLLGAVIARDD